MRTCALILRGEHHTSKQKWFGLSLSFMLFVAVKTEANETQERLHYHGLWSCWYFDDFLIKIM